MDTGNDPGRDEYGLPPVDVEIPDDARDLDPDVHAYHRELRARRRRLRFRRLTGPLTRHGMVMPLVAACLAVTLLTGTLLTVLSGRRVPLLPARTAPGTTSSSPATRRSGPQSTAPQSTAPPTQATAGQGRQLPDVPDVQVTLGNTHVPLRTLVPAVLAWIPAGCSCGRVLRQLASQAAAAKVPIYFVGTAAAVAQLPELASQAGPGNRGKVINDTTDALRITYQPAGLTAILAHRDDSVAALDVVRRLPSQAGLRQFKTRLSALAADSRTSAPGPTATASAVKERAAPRP